MNNSKRWEPMPRFIPAAASLIGVLDIILNCYVLAASWQHIHVVCTFLTVAWVAGCYIVFDTVNAALMHDNKHPCSLHKLQWYPLPPGLITMIIGGGWFVITAHAVWLIPPTKPILWITCYALWFAAVLWAADAIDTIRERRNEGVLPTAAWARCFGDGSDDTGESTGGGEPDAPVLAPSGNSPPTLVAAVTAPQESGP